MIGTPGDRAVLVLFPAAKPTPGNEAALVFDRPRYGTSEAAADAYGADDGADAQAGFHILFEAASDAPGADDSATAAARFSRGTYAAGCDANGADDGADARNEYAAVLLLTDRGGVAPRWMDGPGGAAIRTAQRWRDMGGLAVKRSTGWRDAQGVPVHIFAEAAACLPLGMALSNRWRDAALAASLAQARDPSHLDIVAGSRWRWRDGLPACRFTMQAEVMGGIVALALPTFWPAPLQPSVRIADPPQGGAGQAVLRWAHWREGLIPTLAPLGSPAIGTRYLVSLLLPGVLMMASRRAIPLRSYIVSHDISVVRLPERTPVAVSKITLSLDAAALHWSVSATLHGAAALDAAMPLADGAFPVFELFVDGYTWQFMVETCEHGESFGGRGISITGRSLSARLTSPDYLPAAYTSPQDMSAQQLAAGQLPIDDSFALAWDGPDWLIPAGAMATDSATPLQIIGMVATAGGMVVVPSRNAQALTARRRYQLPPWAYGDATPTLVIPTGKAFSPTYRTRPPTQANAVFVHGGAVGGVMARVMLSGTAADMLADTVYDPLITDLDAARERGIRELAALHGGGKLQSLELLLGGTFPLIDIGDLIEYGGERAIASGVAVSIEVSKGSIKVRQALTLSEDIKSDWHRFKSLIDPTPTLQGVVAAVYADGTASVSLPRGGSVRVGKGGFDVAAGAHVYIMAGKIIDLAPAMTAVDIEV